MREKLGVFRFIPSVIEFHVEAVHRPCIKPIEALENHNGHCGECITVHCGDEWRKELCCPEVARDVC